MLRLGSVRIDFFWRYLWRRVISKRAIHGLGLGMALVVASNLYVEWATTDRRFQETTYVPREQVAIVFGAGVRPDGTLSRMLADRVDGAVELYRTGLVQKLLMSGDHSRPDYDEVGAMKRYAISRGVPDADITLDHAGFSTYESCYRAHAIFGVSRAVLVTQKYHLARAVYTCRELGIDAIGFGTPDWEAYSTRVMLAHEARETLSILKALWEVHVTRPLPTFLGRFEGIA